MCEYGECMHVPPLTNFAHGIPINRNTYDKCCWLPQVFAINGVLCPRRGSASCYSAIIYIYFDVSNVVRVNFMPHI